MKKTLSKETIHLSDKVKECILSLDLGEKTLGMAISDTLGIAPEPLQSLVLSKEQGFPFAHIKKLVKEQGIVCILIGYPYKADIITTTSVKSSIRMKVKRLRARLKKYFPNTAIEVVDESLSTWAARQNYIKKHNKMPVKLGKSQSIKKKSSTHIDSLAALEILNSYLQNK